MISIISDNIVNRAAENMEMKTLVIHPHDTTTLFLEPVYEHVADKTVIRGGITKKELASLVSSHDRIMMMGHGSPWGLLSVGQFPGAGSHIIDYDIAQLLKGKWNSVFIWCNADKYVNCHMLKGFFTGMFISEVREALLMGLGMLDQSWTYLMNPSAVLQANISA